MGRPERRDPTSDSNAFRQDTLGPFYGRTARTRRTHSNLTKRCGWRVTNSERQRKTYILCADWSFELQAKIILPLRATHFSEVSIVVCKLNLPLTGQIFYVEGLWVQISGWVVVLTQTTSLLKPLKPLLFYVDTWNKPYEPFRHLSFR